MRPVPASSATDRPATRAGRGRRSQVRAGSPSEAIKPSDVEGASPDKPRTGTYLVTFIWCAVITVLIHCPMLFKRHAEGDEIVYYTLSQQMGWDLSHYTTRDDPQVRNFPYSIYQAPLFHHPPLLPLFLKAGAYFTANPLLLLPGVATPRLKPGTSPAVVPAECVAAAFWLDVFVCIAALWYAWRFLERLEIEPRWGVAALIGITLCPLILFSTVRLHHDALMGLMLLCGLVAFAEALDSRRLVPSLEAAVWLVAAMNVRFNAIVALPVILLMPFYRRARLFGTQRDRDPAQESAPNGRLPANWLAPAIVLSAVLTIGAQHYYRLIAVYGTLSPSEIIQPVGDVSKFSPFLALLERQNRSWICWEFAAIFPLAILFVAPWNLRRFLIDLRGRDWSPAFVVIFALLFVAQLALAYKPIRYFAAVVPFMHLCWPYLLRNSSQRRWVASATWGLAGLTLLLMVTTGFLNATLHDPDQASILPSLTVYWPPFLTGYRAP